jgi:adenylate cyclase
MSSRRVIRSFAFLDLCGFTAHMDERGDDDAVQALSAMRAATRASAEEYGVRIGKWLGDGAMLVGMEHDPVLQCALGIRDRLPAGSQPPLRGGVSTGPVVLFEGDDYVGWAVNIAARLCAAAAPWQILVSEHEEELPDSGDGRMMRVRGLSRPIDVRQFSRVRGQA